MTQSGANPWELARAARVVNAGGVIAYPTEAVFGLGCDPMNGSAVDRVLQLKRRSRAKGLVVIAGAIEQLEGLVVFPNAEVFERTCSTWPGPVTWILPACSGVPRWLTGGRRCIAVRVTAHPVARPLCAKVGPIVSTSANLSGRVPARTAWKVRAYFRDAVDYIVPGKVMMEGVGTEIRDGLTGMLLRSAGARVADRRS